LVQAADVVPAASGRLGDAVNRDPIQVREDMHAPAFDRYVATYGDWDLGDPQGTGSTPAEAIANLKWNAGEDE